MAVVRTTRTTTMRMRRSSLSRPYGAALLVLLAALGVGACSRAQYDRPLVVVHKSETCGCCVQWVEHVKRAGFAVEVHDESNLDAVKTRLGVPPTKGSCHTAEVDGYLIEGHVPAEDIRRLLAERPDARGLVVAGMPAGSPGMEVPDGHTDHYVVELVERDGSTRTYSEHPGTPPTIAPPAP